MTKIDGDFEQAPGGAMFHDKSAAARKWDEERGAEICYVAEWLRRRSVEGVYLYEIVYRADLQQRDDPMLLIKGIDDGSPVVAFVYAQGLLTGLSTLAGLLRAGKLKWREDQFPSNKVKQVTNPTAEG